MKFIMSEFFKNIITKQEVLNESKDILKLLEDKNDSPIFITISELDYHLRKDILLEFYLNLKKSFEKKYNSLTN